MRIFVSDLIPPRIPYIAAWLNVLALVAVGLLSFSGSMTWAIVLPHTGIILLVHGLIGAWMLQQLGRGYKPGTPAEALDAQRKAPTLILADAKKRLLLFYMLAVGVQIVYQCGELVRAGQLYFIASHRDYLVDTPLRHKRWLLELWPKSLMLVLAIGALVFIVAMVRFQKKSAKSRTTAA